MTSSNAALLLSDMSELLDAQWLGADVSFSMVGIDTRALKKDALFVAIKGENFDGHDFVAAAEQQGASALVVERQVQSTLPQLVVENTRRALGLLARAWRQQFSMPVIAVTGSNGKTTVKEMLASILQEGTSVLATKGNLNNDIGVPLTLFELSAEHDYAVIEMGANHPGEIAWLAEIAAPTVGVVTLAAAAHLEGFKSLEGVAKAKGELFAVMDASSIVVINADDQYAELWQQQSTTKTALTFGMSQAAAVSAKRDIQSWGSQLSVSVQASDFCHTGFSVDLKLLGEHNVMNALAATACAVAVGIDQETIVAGLEKMRPVKHRLESRRGVNKSLIIDDSYNANPSSLAAGLKVLMELPGQHWLALGDMGELGDDAENIHFEAGRLAKNNGIDRLFGLGEYTRKAIEGFGVGATHCKNHEDMIAQLQQKINQDVNLLIKGSRSMHMEVVTAALTTETGAHHAV